MPVIADKQEETSILRMRHSLSHVMAQAVQKLWPGTLLGFGPPIDDGFYYDFIFPSPISDADLPKIEAEMKRIIKAKQPFVRETLDVDAALERLREMNEPHKLEYAKELIEKQGLKTLTFYSNGPFVDMCEGPHVDNTGDLPYKGFKLHSLAGAYWRGDERNVMMTRIYAYAYPTAAELRGRIMAVEQAKKRDHRKLGKDLEIFVIDDEVGPGLPLWLPNGAAIRHELEKLAHEIEFQEGYQLVATPHLTKGSLYVTSGHIPLYLDSMFPPMTLHEDEAGSKGEGDGANAGDDHSNDYSKQYYLKPMNCPHHHKIFAARPRSYRELPMRLAEYGSVYRYEKAGSLQGLTRVRGMTMNDAHIYVSEEGLKDEFKAVMELHRRYYKMFDFDDYYLRLSLWDPDDPKRKSKYVDDPENWARTEKLVQDALEELGLDYKLVKGEAAFYGPKVDFQFRTVIEREFTVSTNQVDFAVPPRFGLHYRDKDGSEKTPYCIHRAPLSTHERFIAFLIEHYGGAFPTWLAPVQVLMIPISDRSNAYIGRIGGLLRQRLVRAEADGRDATTGKKIREGITRKIPILLIIGDKEVEAGTVTVRRYGIEKQITMPLETFLSMLDDEIRERRHVKDW